MSFRICSIASGSTGNCIYISTDSTTIIVDEGAPVTRVERCLTLLGRGKELALLITHGHSDHISNAPQFVRRNKAVVYCHYKTAETLLKKGEYDPKNVIEFSEGDFTVGDIIVTPFKVGHDVPCVGYVFSHKGKQIGVVTDVGHLGGSVLSRLKTCNLVLIESNHDVDMLRVNKNYSPWLKSRILSDSGHLSNGACAEACVKLAAAGVKQFILAHLSQENNYPELALDTTLGALYEAGYEDVGVEVARADKMSSLFEIT